MKKENGLKQVSSIIMRMVKKLMKLLIIKYLPILIFHILVM